MSSVENAGRGRAQNDADAPHPPPSGGLESRAPDDRAEAARLNRALADMMRQNEALETRIEELDKELESRTAELEYDAARLEAQQIHSQLLDSERTRKHDAGLCTAYLKLWTDYGDLAPAGEMRTAVRAFVEANRGSPEAATRVKEELLGLAAVWFEYVTQPLTRLAVGIRHEEAFTLGLRTKYEFIQSLSPTETDAWHGLLESQYRYNTLAVSLEMASTAAARVVHCARHSLSHGNPGMVFAAFATAGTAVSMYRGLSHQTNLAFDSLITQTANLTPAIKRAADAEQKLSPGIAAKPQRHKPLRIRLTSFSAMISSARESVSASRQAASTNAADGPRASNPRSHAPDEVIPPVLDPYPVINPATGLPMIGGGAGFDVGGNTFGFNNFSTGFGGPDDGIGSGFD